MVERELVHRRHVPHPHRDDEQSTGGDRVGDDTEHVRPAVPQHGADAGRMNQCKDVPVSVPSSASSPIPWKGMTSEVRYVEPSGGP